MAEAKSLRQEGYDPPRNDLYSWPTPEQTVEGEAATTIESLLADKARLKEALLDLREHPKIAGCRPIGATSRFGNLRARFDAADAALNRSTDHAG
jgi:hypothetical protein